MTISWPGGSAVFLQWDDVGREEGEPRKALLKLTSGAWPRVGVLIDAALEEWGCDADGDQIYDDAVVQFAGLVAAVELFPVGYNVEPEAGGGLRWAR